MTADIIEFPRREQENALPSSIARLEDIVRELERLGTDRTQEGLDHLLAIMERMADQLVVMSHLLLDEDTQRRAVDAFTSLSDKISETRQALDEFAQDDPR